MPRPIALPRRPYPIRTPILALTVALAATALLGSAGADASQTKVVAKKADNTTLNKTILTNTKGRTLYSLSAETKGKFICTASCLSTWHPLVVPAGVTPRGPVRLGTIERPDGRTQVTFKGRPLYSFAGDTKNGEANGEGIKDVGTWHAASLGKLAAEPKPEPQPQPYPPGYPY
jgi:predicted lipoprotein with Yx(FWY)xxD motif